MADRRVSTVQPCGCTRVVGYSPILFDFKAYSASRDSTLPDSEPYCIFFVDTSTEVYGVKARIQKWGNSLALRIPRSFAVEAHLEQDSLVELALVDGKLIVVPVAEPALTLDQLLAGVTEQNLHGEVDTGQATGNEIW